jgi:hypothetical protein
MADRKDFFREIAAQYRQLAEIASNPEIKQRMLDIAATYQAKADEDNTLATQRRAISACCGSRFEPR